MPSSNSFEALNKVSIISVICWFLVKLVFSKEFKILLILFMTESSPLSLPKASFTAFTIFVEFEIRDLLSTKSFSSF